MFSFNLLIMPERLDISGPRSALGGGKLAGLLIETGVTLDPIVLTADARRLTQMGKGFNAESRRW